MAKRLTYKTAWSKIWSVSLLAFKIERFSFALSLVDSLLKPTI